MLQLIVDSFLEEKSTNVLVCAIFVQIIVAVALVGLSHVCRVSGWRCVCSSLCCRVGGLLKLIAHYIREISE